MPPPNGKGPRLGVLKPFDAGFLTPLNTGKLNGSIPKVLFGIIDQSTGAIAKPGEFPLAQLSIQEVKHYGRVRDGLEADTMRLGDLVKYGGSSGLLEMFGKDPKGAKGEIKFGDKSVFAVYDQLNSAVLITPHADGKKGETMRFLGDAAIRQVPREDGSRVFDIISPAVEDSQAGSLYVHAIRIDEKGAHVRTISIDEPPRSEDDALAFGTGIQLGTKDKLLTEPPRADRYAGVKHRDPQSVKLDEDSLPEVIADVRRWDEDRRKAVGAWHPDVIGALAGVEPYTEVKPTLDMGLNGVVDKMEKARLDAGASLEQYVREEANTNFLAWTNVKDLINTTDDNTPFWNVVDKLQVSFADGSSEEEKIPDGIEKFTIVPGLHNVHTATETQIGFAHSPKLVFDRREDGNPKAMLDFGSDSNSVDDRFVDLTNASVLAINDVDKKVTGLVFVLPSDDSDSKPARARVLSIGLVPFHVKENPIQDKQDYTFSKIVDREIVDQAGLDLFDHQVIQQAKALSSVTS